MLREGPEGGLCAGEGGRHANCGGGKRDHLCRCLETRGVLSNPEKAGVVVEGGQREGRGLEK